MSRMRRGCFAILAILPSFLRAEIPPDVTRLVTEMRKMGSTCRVGVSPELGLFIVGIGQACYRVDNLANSFEVADICAKKQVASALCQAFRAKDVACTELTIEGTGRPQVTAFLASCSETKIGQIMKGWQVVSSGKNADGQMEVVGVVFEKMENRIKPLTVAQLDWEEQGVVTAVGVDVDRASAEKNALRSAVEQIAGTLVVGKVSVNDREELHKRLATTAGALVESYRVVKETRTESGFRIEILARVSKKKLYDNYRAYFKSLDDPKFCLVATDPALIQSFNQFFVEKGLRLTNRLDDAQYLIKLDGRFRDRPTPRNAASEGTMLDLRIVVETVDGSRILLTMNERQSKDSEVLSKEQRREEIARRIFLKLKARLHRAIHEMVVQMLDDADDKSVIKVDACTTTF